MYVCKQFSYDFYWKSTWPVQRFDILDFLHDSIEPLIQLNIRVHAACTRNLMLSTGSTAYGSYDQSTGSYESHSQLLPKS